jgi:cell division protein YceG involved in septum cleavage
MTNVLRWLALVAGGLVAIAVLVLGLLFHAFDKPGALEGPAIVVVPKGAGVSTIARLLARNGIIGDALVFEAGVLITGNSAAMPAHVMSWIFCVRARPWCAGLQCPKG